MENAVEVFIFATIDLRVGKVVVAATAKRNLVGETTIKELDDNGERKSDAEKKLLREEIIKPYLSNICDQQGWLGYRHQGVSLRSDMSGSLGWLHIVVPASQSSPHVLHS